VELWYESSLQILYGASIITLMLWLCQRTTHGVLRYFVWLSWLEAVWLIVMALSREEWRLLWLAAGGAIKALVFPYLSRRWPDCESAQKTTLTPTSAMMIFVLMAILCMFVGRSAGPLYRLNGEALGVVFLICISALFSVATQATARSRLLSLALLESGLVLFGAHINPQVPMGWAFVSIALLLVLFWRLADMRADTNSGEA
jgi:hydrogenase-4 membrane subunit HyfE